MIRFYALNVAPLRDETLYARARERLSEARKAKADAFRFHKDRCLSVGAGILLDCGLRSYGLREKNIEYGVRENGKPFFLNAPSLHFNLSHSGTMAVCAFSDEEIGCDIEIISNIGMDVAKRFFFCGEYEHIASQETQERQADLFYRYWTLKESFMKMTGLGFALALDAFEIRIGDDAISVSHSVDEEACHFKEFGMIDGYKCALCSRCDCRDTVLKQIDLHAVLNG